MKIDFQGRVYDLDLSDINIKPAMVIQGYTGLSVNAFAESLTDTADAGGNITERAADKPGFLKSLAAVHWLMLQQNGVTSVIGDADFPVGAFSEAVAGGVTAEALAEAEAHANAGPEPDPTRPSPGSAPSPGQPSPTSPPPPQQAAPDAPGSPHG